MDNHQFALYALEGTYPDSFTLPVAPIEDRVKSYRLCSNAAQNGQYRMIETDLTTWGVTTTGFDVLYNMICRVDWNATMSWGMVDPRVWSRHTCKLCSTYLWFMWKKGKRREVLYASSDGMWQRRRIHCWLYGDVWAVSDDEMNYTARKSEQLYFFNSTMIGSPHEGQDAVGFTTEDMRGMGYEVLMRGHEKRFGAVCVFHDDQQRWLGVTGHLKKWTLRMNERIIVLQKMKHFFKNIPVLKGMRDCHLADYYLQQKKDMKQFFKQWEVVYATPEYFKNMSSRERCLRFNVWDQTTDTLNYIVQSTVYDHISIVRGDEAPKKSYSVKNEDKFKHFEDLDISAIKYDEDVMTEWTVKDKGQVIIEDNKWLPVMIRDDGTTETKGPRNEDEEKKEELEIPQTPSVPPYNSTTQRNRNDALYTDRRKETERV